MAIGSRSARGVNSAWLVRGTRFRSARPSVCRTPVGTHGWGVQTSAADPATAQAVSKSVTAPSVARDASAVSVAVVGGVAGVVGVAAVAGVAGVGGVVVAARDLVAARLALVDRVVVAGVAALGAAGRLAGGRRETVMRLAATWSRSRLGTWKVLP